MIVHNPPALPGKGLAQEIAERAAQMYRDMANFNPQSRRPVRPWAYWQFKNGKLAPLSGPRDLPFDMEIDWYLAYDRSLGCDVVYAAR